MHRIGVVFSQVMVSTAAGLAAGTFVPIPILVSLLAGLTGARLILQRSRSRRARRVLNFGSSEARRAA
jgi:hypothetical protein